MQTWRVQLVDRPNKISTVIRLGFGAVLAGRHKSRIFALNISFHSIRGCEDGVGEEEEA